MGLSAAFALTMELGYARGARSIKGLPRCYEMKVDDHWWVAINPHDKPVCCSTGAEVIAFSIWIEFNGWPAGMLTPQGGLIAAGSLANEDTYIEALKAAIAPVRRSEP